MCSNFSHLFQMVHVVCNMIKISLWKDYFKLGGFAKFTILLPKKRSTYLTIEHFSQIEDRT